MGIGEATSSKDGLVCKEGIFELLRSRKRRIPVVKCNRHVGRYGIVSCIVNAENNPDAVILVTIHIINGEHPIRLGIQYIHGIGSGHFCAGSIGRFKADAVETRPRKHVAEVFVRADHGDVTTCIITNVPLVRTGAI